MADETRPQPAKSSRATPCVVGLQVYDGRATKASPFGKPVGDPHPSHAAAAAACHELAAPGDAKKKQAGWKQQAAAEKKE